MFGNDKGSGGEPGLDPCKECGNGHSSGRYTPCFGMILSRSWGSKVGGSIKLDLTYATIPTFGGE